MDRNTKMEEKEMTTKAERKAAKRAQRQEASTPSPSELLGKSSNEPEVAETPVAETPVAETPIVEAEAKEAPAEVTEAKEASTLEQIVANLAPELREKAQVELAKLVSQATKNEAAKKFVAFDMALNDKEHGLPKLIGDLAKKHELDLSNRRITVSYPDGKFAYTNSPKGSKSTNGSREGFPAPWGKAEVVKEGKVIQAEASPSKLAETLGLQVEGMRNMIDVFENPHERDTKAELPKLYSVDAVRGEHFRVTITS